MTRARPQATAVQGRAERGWAGWVLTLPRPWRTGRAGLVPDATIAVAVAAVQVVGALLIRGPGRNVPFGALPLLGLMGLALGPRRRRPGGVLGVVGLLCGVLYASRVSLEGAFPAVLIAGYSGGVHSSHRTRVATAAVATAALVIGVLLAGIVPSRLAPAPVPTALAGIGSWFVGILIRTQSAARAAQLDERARRAERLRIARELHDLVSHHLSVVVVQAQAAQRVIGRDADAARQVMATVEASGREALEEMRSLLGVLRASGDNPADEDGEVASFVPNPGVAAVEELIAQVGATGLVVSLEVAGDRRRLPAPVELSVYRIVQEALTNAIKYAGGARVSVRLDYGEDEFAVMITDDGPGPGGAHGAATLLPESGYGLVGMAERATLLGGRLRAGPQPAGGYQVAVRIPLSDPTSRPA